MAEGLQWVASSSSSVSHAEAAVDGEDLSGDVVGLVRGEEDDEFGDL